MNEAATRPISATAGEALSPLFPDENGAGLALSQERLKALSRHYSTLYLALLAELTGPVARELDLPARSVELVMREGLVPPLHCFLDRLLRLEEFGRARAAPAVAAAPPPRDTDDAAAFRAAAQSSTVFNAGLLAQAALLLGWPVVEAGAPAEPALAAAPAGRNSNFDGETFPAKVIRRLRALLARRGRPLPCASLSYTDGALRAAGFLGRRLEFVMDRAAWSSAPRDAALRQRRIVAPVAASPAVDAFLDAAGWPAARDKGEVRAALGRWLARHMPSAYFEGLASNLARGRELLAPYAPRPFVLAEVNSLDATLLMASARALDMPVIGLQHGGHYGYIEDHTLALDLEYSYYDRFVSWGWEGMPDWDVCRDVALTALSCPWLEQRRRHWARVHPPERRDPRGKPHDVLLLTNKLYRFPPAPSGAAICRSDRAAQLRSALTGFAQACAAAGVSMLHKPYNPSTVAQLRGTLADMARAAGPLYRELAASGKGLTPELLGDCGLVVWDQPGTGFLECLAAELPTLCWWPRVYNEEEPRRREIFSRLEAAGLVHRSAAGLAEEVVRFKADPAAWQAEPSRRAAAAEFSRLFGRADPRWTKEWEEFFEGASR